MRLHHKHTCAVLFTSLALLFGMQLRVAFADPPEHGHGQMDGPRHDRVESVIIGKFVSELDLTPEQSEKFFPLLKQHHQKMEDIQHQNMDLRDQLDDLSHNPKADQVSVSKLLDQRNAQTKKIMDANREFLNSVSSILTPQQVSKCSILLEEMPRRIREFIDQRREERMGGQGAPQPGRGSHKNDGD